MSDDPSYALQVAIVAKLRADPDVVAIVAASPVAGVSTPGVWDRVPPNAKRPYIVVGEIQVLADDAEGIVGSESFNTIHVWADDLGMKTAKRLAGVVRKSLHEAELSLTGQRLIEIRFAETRFINDPDGVLTHGIMTFRALSEPS